MARKLIIILIFILSAAVLVFADDTRGLKPDGTWKPQKAKLLINKSSFAGLNSKCSITVTDSDKNMKADGKDTVFVKVVSDADPKGFQMRLVETTSNSGVFAGDLKFTKYESKPKLNQIKVGPKSTIKISYVEDDTIEAAARFQMAEAKLSTSGDVQEGLGGYMTITVQDPDADINYQRNTVAVKAASKNTGKGLTLFLEETGAYTGIFKGKLYFAEKRVRNKEKEDCTIIVEYGDQLDISYTDNTLPEDGKKVITKTISCEYDTASVAFNKTKYSGYNTSAVVTVKDFEANTGPSKRDKVRLHIRSTSDEGFNITMDETGADSGEFKASVHFGRRSDRSENTLKVSNGDKIYAVYEDRGDYGAGEVEASADWQANDGQIKLDRQVYYGNKAEVKVTLKDVDINRNAGTKDMVYVYAGAAGETDTIKVRLAETGNNTGTFTGTFGINNRAQRGRSVFLDEDGKLEVRYSDEDCTENIVAERIASASWKGASEPKLELDRKEYRRYDTYMTVKLTDYDENVSSGARDVVHVYAKAGSGRTNVKLKLTETGYNTGIFTGKLRFVDGTPSAGEILVKDGDEVVVTFRDSVTKEEAEARATFKEE